MKLEQSPERAAALTASTTATDGAVVVTDLDELRRYIGKETRVGDWHLVTQAEIDQFAAATGDHQWIHVDPERARNVPYGGTIAHGFWTLSAALFLLRNGGHGSRSSFPFVWGSTTVSTECGSSIQSRLANGSELTPGCSASTRLRPTSSSKSTRSRSK